MATVLDASFEQALLEEANKVRVAAVLPPLQLYAGYHDIAEAHVMSIADGTTTVVTDGYEERASKIFLTCGGYHEASGRLPFESDVEWRKQFLSEHKSKLKSRDVSEIAIMAVKKGKYYSWLAGFMCKERPIITKRKKDEAKIASNEEEQEILAAINKVRTAKGLDEFALLGSFHPLGEAHVLAIATGRKPLTTEGFKERAAQVAKTGMTAYKEGIGFRVGTEEVPGEVTGRILSGQAKHIENPELTHVGIIVVSCGEATVWLLGFAK